MRRYTSFLAILLSTCIAYADPVSVAERTRIIDSVLKHVQTSYIDAEQARALEPILRHADFSQAKSDEAFAKAVSVLMQDATKDQHLKLVYSAEPVPERKDGAPTPAEIAEWRASLKADNYGIERVERLPGNIGYLKTNFFPPADELAPSLAAAMTLLSNTGALIIDLRENGGGAVDAVPLVASYFFDERKHLADLYQREGNKTDQQWTYPGVAGNRFGAEKEVYILTSKNTFSGAEGLAYALKNQKRATIVGETTRGGAHPSIVARIDAHYAVFVPVSVVHDMVTGKDWEGVGVAPDLAVPAEEALTRAQVVILNKMLVNPPKTENPDEIRKRLDELRGKH